jgi:hypothetical protein
MIPTLKKCDDVILDPIDQPVFLGDPPAPTPREVMFKGFGLADAFKRIGVRIIDECIDLVAFP